MIQINTPDVSWRILDEEAIIINLKTGYYYSLNQTGTYIWTLISDRKRKLPEIVTSVSERYRKPAAQVQRDVTDILGSLLKEKLIKGSLDA